MSLSVRLLLVCLRKNTRPPAGANTRCSPSEIANEFFKRFCIMPKVSKKAGREEAAVLEAAPLPMETADDEQPSPSGAAPKPSFAPISAFDQNGRRVEFRRVRGVFSPPQLCLGSV